MGAATRIEWTDATWNPWMGCARVSPGCAHCYMFSEQRRYGHDPEVVRRSKTKFTEPLRWSGPLRVFTCSWSDWFIPAADEWRDEAWDVIRRTPHLTYQILTKRPELIADRLPADWGDGWPNVWLGTSVENRRFVQRAEVLAEVPARVRFISAEPLLGPVGFSDYLRTSFRCPDCGLLHRQIPTRCLRCGRHTDPPGYEQPIHWVIVGGESGPRARRMDPEWLRSLRDQCQTAAVPFFFKQWGGRANKHGHDDAVLDGRRWVEMPERTA